MLGHHFKTPLSVTILQGIALEANVRGRDKSASVRNTISASRAFLCCTPLFLVTLSFKDALEWSVFKSLGEWLRTFLMCDNIFSHRSPKDCQLNFSGADAQQVKYRNAVVSSCLRSSANVVTHNVELFSSISCIQCHVHPTSPSEINSVWVHQSVRAWSRKIT